MIGIFYFVSDNGVLRCLSSSYNSTFGSPEIMSTLTAPVGRVLQHSSLTSFFFLISVVDETDDVG